MVRAATYRAATANRASLRSYVGALVPYSGIVAHIYTSIFVIGQQGQQAEQQQEERRRVRLAPLQPHSRSAPYASFLPSPGL